MPSQLKDSNVSHNISDTVDVEPETEDVVVEVIEDAEAEEDWWCAAVWVSNWVRVRNLSLQLLQGRYSAGCFVLTWACSACLVVKIWAQNSQEWELSVVLCEVKPVETMLLFTLAWAEQSLLWDLWKWSSSCLLDWKVLLHKVQVNTTSTESSVSSTSFDQSSSVWENTVGKETWVVCADWLEIEQGRFCWWHGVLYTFTEWVLVRPFSVMRFNLVWRRFMDARTLLNRWLVGLLFAGGISLDYR